MSGYKRYILGLKPRSQDFGVCVFAPRGRWRLLGRWVCERVRGGGGHLGCAGREEEEERRKKKIIVEMRVAVVVGFCETS